MTSPTTKRQQYLRRSIRRVACELVDLGAVEPPHGTGRRGHRDGRRRRRHGRGRREPFSEKGLLMREES